MIGVGVTQAGIDGAELGVSGTDQTSIVIEVGAGGNEQTCIVTDA